MLIQSLVRKFHCASSYSTLQYLNDRKISAKNINGWRIKRHSNVVDFKCVPAWVVVGWGEVLLFFISLMNLPGIDNPHKIPKWGYCWECFWIKSKFSRKTITKKSTQPLLSVNTNLFCYSSSATILGLLWLSARVLTDSEVVIPTNTIPQHLASAPLLLETLVNWRPN